MTKNGNLQRLERKFGHLRGHDIFGAWVPIVALTASKSKPISLAQHDLLVDRLEKGLADIMDSEHPQPASWRDLADMQNFLQSLIELGWATDEGHYIDGAKQALYGASQALEKHGVIRFNGQGITAIREALDQFAELTRAMSAHSYWVAVKHTKQRVDRVARGQKKPDDVVVSI